MQVMSGDGATWNALVFGFNNPINTDYFKNQVESIRNVVTDATKSFFANAGEIYERFNGSQAMQLVRSALNMTSGIFQPQCVKPLVEINDFHQATITMQRWVMANPIVRQWYHDQRCDGYSDTYVDVSPGLIGENHYDYRRVMDGVVQMNEEHGWIAKFYPEDLLEGDRELLPDEKADIISTWEIVEMFMKAGEVDPTSVYASTL